MQKFISDAGLCSRRQAELLIRQGKVKVNGHAAELGMRADAGDIVLVNGKKISSRGLDHIYIALHKPAGYTCTSREFKNEQNVFSLVKVKERLFVVGRLDKDSTGLVILTNDGQWAQRVTHPKYRHEKEYIVRLATDKKISVNQACTLVDILQKGVHLADNSVGRAQAVKYLGDGVFNMILTQGKKRQIREMFASLGYKVVSLLRTRIGDVLLNDLAEGQWQYISVKK